MCLIKYKLDPAKFISAPGLAWQAALKKTKVKLGLLTDIDLLLMVQKRIRGGIATLFVNMQKIMKDYIWKIMIKVKNRHIFNIGM